MAGVPESLAGMAIITFSAMTAIAHPAVYCIRAKKADRRGSIAMQILWEKMNGG